MANFIEIVAVGKSVHFINTEHIVCVSEIVRLGEFQCTQISLLNDVHIKTDEAYADVKQKILSAGEIIMCAPDIFKAVIE